MERTGITLRRIINIVSTLMDDANTFPREQKQKISQALVLLTEVLNERSAE